MARLGLRLFIVISSRGSLHRRTVRLLKIEGRLALVIVLILAFLLADDERVRCLVTDFAALFGRTVL